MKISLGSPILQELCDISRTGPDMCFASFILWPSKPSFSACETFHFTMQLPKSISRLNSSSPYPLQIVQNLCLLHPQHLQRFLSLSYQPLYSKWKSLYLWNQITQELKVRAEQSPDFANYALIFPLHLFPASPKDSFWGEDLLLSEESTECRLPGLFWFPANKLSWEHDLSMEILWLEKLHASYV